MEDNKLELKDIYDDAILEATIRGAELTKRFHGRRRVDNTSGHLLESMSGKISARLAKEKQGDGIVANGISTALQISMIIYGKIGEEFLKSKLSKKGIEFSQREYSKRCAEAMVRRYKGKRGAKIVEGVLLAIDNDPNSIEAIAAKAGIMINEYTIELDTKNKVKVKEDYDLGKIIESSIIFERLDEMNYKQISNNEKIRRLEILYNFINSNKEKVNFECLKKDFPDASEDELIVFYIANLDEIEVERGLLLASKA